MIFQSLCSLLRLIQRSRVIHLLSSYCTKINMISS
nr:MAG TPA: hypothetical protein [Caudoviricetes sp.]